jgi:hypothetical protein
MPHEQSIEQPLKTRPSSVISAAPTTPAWQSIDVANETVALRAAEISSS